VPRDEDPSTAGHPAPEIVRATADVLVLAKPAGLPSVALLGAPGDSLAARIAAHFPECAQVGRPGEAGLVHRLDTGTSGLLLAARNQATYDALRAQFRARTVRKEYLALVSGTIQAPMRITTPIGQHRGTRRRMRAVAAESAGDRYRARPASTDVSPERVLRGATLVRAATTSGARHQIRVHLASIGHPLLADPVYGDAARKPGATQDALRGFFLHACRIEWRDPATGEDASDRLAPPGDWSDVLEELGTSAARAR
jgi:23S rRNA pseudouridine1911/1915/1917 synthase